MLAELPPRWIECQYVQPGLGLLGLKNGQIPIVEGTPLSVGRTTACSIRLLCDDAVLSERAALFLFEAKSGTWFGRRGTLLHVTAPLVSVQVLRLQAGSAGRTAGLSLDGAGVASQQVWLNDGDRIELWTEEGNHLLRLGFHSSL